MGSLFYLGGKKAKKNNFVIFILCDINNNYPSNSRLRKIATVLAPNKLTM